MGSAMRTGYDGVTKLTFGGRSVDRVERLCTYELQNQLSFKALNEASWYHGRRLEPFEEPMATNPNSSGEASLGRYLTADSQ
jgi:hypothetical protein